MCFQNISKLSVEVWQYGADGSANYLFDIQPESSACSRVYINDHIILIQNNQHVFNIFKQSFTRNRDHIEQTEAENSQCNYRIFPEEIRDQDAQINEGKNACIQIANQREDSKSIG